MLDSAIAFTNLCIFLPWLSLQPPNGTVKLRFKESYLECPNTGLMQVLLFRFMSICQCNVIRVLKKLFSLFTYYGRHLENRTNQICLDLAITLHDKHQITMTSIITANLLQAQDDRLAYTIVRHRNEAYTHTYTPRRD